MKLYRLTEVDVPASKVEAISDGGLELERVCGDLRSGYRRNYRQPRYSVFVLQVRPVDFLFDLVEFLHTHKLQQIIPVLLRNSRRHDRLHKTGEEAGN